LLEVLESLDADAVLVMIFGEERIGVSCSHGLDVVVVVDSFGRCSILRSVVVDVIFATM
jgi:hypothetical protein